jgi:hypothetical protein
MFTFKPQLIDARGTQLVTPTHPAGQTTVQIQHAQHILQQITRFSIPFSWGKTRETCQGQLTKSFQTCACSANTSANLKVAKLDMLYDGTRDNRSPDALLSTAVTFVSTMLAFTTP